jgi:hypothetical protein
MKNTMRITGLVCLLAVMSLTACKDNGSSAPTGEIPSVFTKKLVVEKFTGEWCGACPASSRWMDDMAEEHGDKFIAIAIHAGSQHDRYKDNPACKTAYSFLLSHLRHPGLSSIGFPNVMFNRNLNSSNNQVINSYTGSRDWTAKAKEEIAEEATCGLSIQSSFEGNNLKVTVKYHLKKALGSNHAVTVYVTENGLDGSEQVSGGSGFMHKHTLRGLLTAKSGDLIDGDAVGETFEMVLDPFDCTGFNKDKLEVVAFINHDGDDYTDREIINGQSVHAGSDQSFD